MADDDQAERERAEYASPALSALHGITGFKIEKTVPVTAGPAAH
ncbi:hypothetical protein [Streptomyces sp. NBC_01589]